MRNAHKTMLVPVRVELPIRVGLCTWRRDDRLVKAATNTAGTIYKSKAYFTSSDDA